MNKFSSKGSQTRKGVQSLPSPQNLATSPSLCHSVSAPHTPSLLQHRKYVVETYFWIKLLIPIFQCSGYPQVGNSVTNPEPTTTTVKPWVKPKCEDQNQ